MRRYLPSVFVLLCLLGCISMGCESRDNPYDPGRCEPACQSGESCVDGHCQKPDLGPDRGIDLGPDLGSDRGPADTGTDVKPDAAPPSYAMLSKQCKGEITTNATTPGLIYCADGSEFKVDVTASGTDSYLFLLNAPDTWVNADYKAASFEIVDVEGSGTTTVIASGGYSNKAGQRIPTTIVGTKKLSAGTHTIQARWGVTFGGGADVKATIGSQGNAWLVVLPAPEGELQAIHGPSQALSKADYAWSNIALSSDPPIEIKTKEQAGKYLVMLNAAGAYVEGAAQTVCVMIVVDVKLTGESKGVALGCLSTGFDKQRIPVTVVAVQDLALGDKISVKWSNAGNPAHLDPGSTWLVALRSPKDITTKALSSSTDVATTSTAGEPIPGLGALDVISAGGDYLFILNVPYTWTNLSTWPPAYYQVALAGTKEFTGSMSSATSSDSQQVPVTIMGVKNLPAGGLPTKVEAWWGVSTCSGCTAALKLRAATLLALTR